mgnify:FL=1|jgi:hypothetical protein
MGLDMYAYRHKGETLTNKERANQDELPEDRKPVQFADWRKHNRLQGFMQELWDKKNGGDIDFNCVPLYLNKDELDMLQKQIETRTLPQTEGFFFGDDSYTWEGEQNDMKAYDLKFCKEAKQWLEKGYKVFYECWW